MAAAEHGAMPAAGEPAAAAAMARSAAPELRGLHLGGWREGIGDGETASGEGEARAWKRVEPSAGSRNGT